MELSFIVQQKSHCCHAPQNVDDFIYQPPPRMEIKLLGR